MQTIVLNNVIINYTESDINYIDELINNLKLKGQQIIDFFNLTTLDRPTYIFFYNTIERFREKAKTRNSTGHVPTWLCGWATTKPSRHEIHVPSFSEYIKTESHENDTIEDIISLVLHEFTHNCFDSYRFQNNNRKTLMWLHEAMATILSNQKNNLTITCSVEDLLSENQVAYHNYFTMGTYLLSMRGKDYILSLIRNYKLLKAETPSIYLDTIKWLDNKNK